MPRLSRGAPAPFTRERGAPQLATARDPGRTAFPLRWVTVAILGLTCVAYIPVMTGEFLQWDDQHYVERSEVIHDPAGLPRIWNPAARATDQYYPLTFTSYWLEFRLWGLDARGYHLTNVGLHLANTVLVVMLAGALGASPAVQAALGAIFALHPAQVASVAWIAERKNTLSALCYLAAFLLYLRHRRSGRWAPYGGALLAFAAALLSKTQTVTLPLVLALAEWCLQRTGRLKRLAPGRIAARLAPMIAVAAVMSVATIHFEQRPWTRTFTVAEQVVIAANAAAFYVRTFLFPFALSPIYPEWRVAATDPIWWLPVAGWAVVAAVAVWQRRRVPALAAFGAAQFFVTLSPVLGFVPFNLQTYTFIADHFLYLAVVGGGLAVAVVVERGIQLLPAAGRRRELVIGVAGLLCVGATLQTAEEAGHWRTNETFWRRVQERDPEGFLGYYNLGNHYRARGQWAEALPYFTRAVEIRPNVDYPFRRWAEALRQVAGEQAVIEASTRKLAAQPGFFAAYLERAVSREAQGQREQAAADYERALRLSPAGSAVWAEARAGRARVGGTAP